MKIADFDLSQKVFIIAELSANHNGSLELAKESIRAAKRAGADAIKLQTYTPDSLTLDCDKSDFIIKNGLWKGRKLYELYAQALTPRQWHKELFDEAKNQDLICFSSPFCKDDVEFLEQFDPVAYKIASFEANDLDFIRFVASKNRPVIISTGIINFNEINEALSVCKQVKNNNIALLKCTSSYPANLEDMNLKSISDMIDKFDTIIGLSDHTLGFLAPVIAVSLGARIIEKHFVLNKDIDSVDSAFSLDEIEFANMVKAIRDSEKLLGTINYDLTQKQQENRVFARSLYACKDIKCGEIFSDENVRSVRPGFGILPKLKGELIGKRASRDIEFGSRIIIDDLKKG